LLLLNKNGVFIFSISGLHFIWDVCKQLPVVEVIVQMFFLVLMSVVIMLISGFQLVMGGAYLVGFSSIGLATLTGIMTHFGYKNFNHSHSEPVKKKKKWYRKLDCGDCGNFGCDSIDCCD
jgi:hypothetical protein